MSRIERLVYAQRRPFVGRLVRHILSTRSVGIPASVRLGSGLVLAHGAVGSVLHPTTCVGDRVTIYQGVTVGRKHVHLSDDEDDFVRVEIEDDVILGAGAVILGGSGITRIGASTIIGANAVVTGSTGPNEVWAGVPARCIGTRPS